MVVVEDVGQSALGDDGPRSDDADDDDDEQLELDVGYDAAVRVWAGSGPPAVADADAPEHSRWEAESRLASRKVDVSEWSRCGTVREHGRDPVDVKWRAVLSTVGAEVGADAVGVFAVDDAVLGRDFVAAAGARTAGSGPRTPGRAVGKKIIEISNHSLVS